MHAVSAFALYSSTLLFTSVIQTSEAAYAFRRYYVPIIRGIQGISDFALHPHGRRVLTWEQERITKVIDISRVALH